MVAPENTTPTWVRKSKPVRFNPPSHPIYLCPIPMTSPEVRKHVRCCSVVSSGSAIFLCMFTLHRSSWVVNWFLFKSCFSNSPCDHEELSCHCDNCLPVFKSSLFESVVEVFEYFVVSASRVGRAGKQGSSCGISGFRDGCRTGLLT